MIDWDVTHRGIDAVFDHIERLVQIPVWNAVKPENRITTFLAKHEPALDPMTLKATRRISGVFVGCAQRRVQMDVLQVRVALERYKLAKKEYPKVLAELVPVYLSAVPVDPFSGKPYGYRVEADGRFLFWSIGEDLKDDGGAMLGGNPWAGADYVFTSRPPKGK